MSWLHTLHMLNSDSSLAPLGLLSTTSISPGYQESSPQGLHSTMSLGSVTELQVAHGLPGALGLSSLLGRFPLRQISINWMQGNIRVKENLFLNNSLLCIMYFWITWNSLWLLMWTIQILEHIFFCINFLLVVACYLATHLLKSTALSYGN